MTTMKPSTYYRARFGVWLLRAILLWHIVLGAIIGGWNAHLYESAPGLFASIIVGIGATGCALFASAEAAGYHRRADAEERWENRGSSTYTLPSA